MNNNTGEYNEIWGHINPSFLIRSTENFIVFIDDDLSLDWETSREYDAKGHKDEKKHNSILNEVALLEATPCDWLSKNMTIHFKRLIGEAIVHSLGDDYINSEKMIVSAKNYIAARSKETSRFWYLSSSFIMSIPFIIGVFVLWSNRNIIDNTYGYTLLPLSMAACSGAIGALLSVIWRSGNMDLDCYAGRNLHYLEGVSRIWVGAICGAIVALAIKTELVLAPLTHGKSTLAVIILTSLAAGAGERLAKSIISTINGQGEKKVINKSKKTKESIDE